jgi:hypothetical protein
VTFVTILAPPAAGYIGPRADQASVFSSSPRAERVTTATGDTRLVDPLTGSGYPTARPLFIRQVGGPALRGTATCS